MNIIVSTNSRYLHVTETMLFSLAENVTRTISIWCLHSRLMEREMSVFRSFLRDKCHVGEVHFVDMQWLKDIERSLPLNIRHISVETYYRLFTQFVLPHYLDKALWLDSDIIVKDSIDELYDQDIEGIPLVAFQNMGEASAGGNAERLGIPRKYSYFNAGVLLLNLDYLRRISSKEQLLNFCLQNGKSFKQQDQDALNLLYFEEARVLDDQRFNCMVNAPQCFSSPNIADQAAIIHYAGWQKPWRIKWQNEYSCYWWDVKRKEGLSYKDDLIMFAGCVWRILRLNTLERWLLSPYHWIEARLKPNR